MTNVDLGLPRYRATQIPSREEVKFYQVGSYAVGNRLVDPELKSNQSEAHRYNSLTSGHRACQGCGEALGARYALHTAMAACDGKLIAVNATGCLYSVSANRMEYPVDSLFVCQCTCGCDRCSGRFESFRQI